MPQGDNLLGCSKGVDNHDVRHGKEFKNCLTGDFSVIFKTDACIDSCAREFLMS